MIYMVKTGCPRFSGICLFVLSVRHIIQYHTPLHYDLSVQVSEGVHDGCGPRLDYHQDRTLQTVGLRIQRFTVSGHHGDREPALSWFLFMNRNRRSVFWSSDLHVCYPEGMAVDTRPSSGCFDRL